MYSKLPVSGLLDDASEPESGLEMSDISQFHISRGLKSSGSSQNDTRNLCMRAFTHLCRTMIDSFRSLRGCPSELYYIYFLNFCESYGYFSVSQILVLYLHNQFGASDVEAGVAYGMWGAAITFWGFALSCINDKLGVRRALIVGNFISCVATFLLAVATSKHMAYAVLFGLMPIGNSIGAPMLTVGVKRCTNAVNRGFAFGLHYAVMNVAALVSGPVIDLFNAALAPDIAVHYGNRLVIFTVSATFVVSLVVLVFFVQDIKNDHCEAEGAQGSPMSSGQLSFSPLHNDHDGTTDDPVISESFTSLEKDAVEHEEEAEDKEQFNDFDAIDDGDTTRQSDDQDVCSTIRQLLHSPVFWRFCLFTVLLINLRAVFRHLDATLPTYLSRCFGTRYPKGMIYSINPLMIIFLTPVVSAMTTTWAHFDMIKFGGYLSAISPLFLAFSTTTWAAVLFMVTLSLGEAIWSPRLYDYTMSVAPNGKEATFSALAAAPLFAAKIPVGLMSGYLVSTYVPETPNHVCPNGHTLWLIIGLLTMTSPVLITLLEKFIREPSAQAMKS